MTLELPARIEHMDLKPYSTRLHLAVHCQEAVTAGYRAILTPSSFVGNACELLEGSNVKVACAIGFPFGSADPDAKRFETELAVDLGAHEIELTPVVSRLIENDLKAVLREIRDIVEAADERPVKVVLETHLWPEDQLEDIVRMALDSGAQYLSTTIALQGRHASPEAVAHLRELAGPKFGIKVAGLKSLAGAEELVAAGADLIGFSP